MNAEQNLSMGRDSVVLLELKSRPGPDVAVDPEYLARSLFSPSDLKPPARLPTVGLLR